MTGRDHPLRRRHLVVLLAAGVLAVGAHAGEPSRRSRPDPVQVQSPSRGFHLEVPGGWKHRLDESGDSLLLGAPGGFRVRIEVQLRGAGIARDDLVAAYKQDGRSLQARFGRVKVLEKPTRASEPGQGKAFRYGFAYRDIDATVMQVRTWLTSGTSRDRSMNLHLKIRAYGERKLFPRYELQLGQVLRSFRFPEPDPLAPAPRVLAGDATSDTLAMADLPPLPIGTPSYEAASVATAGVLPPRNVPRPVYGAPDSAKRKTFLASFGIKQSGSRATSRQRATSSLGFVPSP